MQAAQSIVDLFAEDRTKIQTLKRAGISVLKVHEYIQIQPYFSITEMAKQLEMTFPTAKSAVENMEKLGMVEETTGQQRHKLYAYQKYLDIITADTEPL